MDEVLELVGDQNHRPFVILQVLQDSLLHQVITEVDVQSREGVVLRRHGFSLVTDINGFIHSPCPNIVQLLDFFLVVKFTHSG